MTENEAIEILKSPTKYTRVIDDDVILSSVFVKAYELAIQVLEENQQYKAISTVEEFKSLTDKGIPIIHGKAELELHDKQIKADAIAELKQRFRNEYEDAEAAEMEDCINWADWLDATAEQILADRKGE